MWLTALDVLAAGFGSACVLYIVARDFDRLTLTHARPAGHRWPTSARGLKPE